MKKRLPLCFSKKTTGKPVAQATIEYLLILGAVITISLAVVGYIMLATPQTEGISEQATELSGAQSAIEIREFVADATGSAAIVLKNNNDEKLTVKRISVDGNDLHIYGFGTRLSSGAKKTFILSNVLPCTETDKKEYSITIYYTSAYDLNKKAVFGKRIAVCVPSIQPIGTYILESAPSYGEPVIIGEEEILLEAGVTSHDLNISTDQRASCRYSLVLGKEYSDMNQVFIGTALVHTTTITGLVEGDNNIFVRCKGGENEVANTQDYQIILEVGSTQIPTTSKYAYFHLDSNFNQPLAIFNRTLLAGSNLGIIPDSNTLFDEYVSEGLAALYHLDDSSGISYIDSSGNGNTLTTQGDVTEGGTGVFNNAADFVGGYLSKNSPTMSVSSEITVSAWIFPRNSSSVSALFAQRGPDCEGEGAWQFYLNAGGGGATGYFNYWSESGNNECMGAYNNFSDSEWALITATYDGSSIRLYKNGIQYTECDGFSGGIINTTQSIVLGQESCGSYFDGMLDDVAIWDRALSDEEIKFIYDKNSALINNGGDHYSDTNYTSAVLDFGSLSTGFNSLSYNNSGLIFGEQINPLLETDLNDGLIGLWHLNETNQTTFTDSSVNENNGACSGDTCPFTSDGLWDTNAKSFDGIGNEIEIVPTYSVSGSFTISAWVMPLSEEPGSILGSRSPNDESFDFKLSGASGGIARNPVIHGDIGDGVNWITNQADAELEYQMGKWIHLVYAVDEENYTIYANGKQIGSGTYDTANPLLFDTSHHLYIGSIGSSEYFFGKIEEVAVWSRVLDSSEIQSLFNKGSARLGLAYRSCNDENCIGEAWSDLNYSAKKNISLLALPQNKYFQYLIKPAWLSFTGFTQGSCSGGVIGSCEDIIADDYDKCISNNYQGGDCYWDEDAAYCQSQNEGINCDNQNTSACSEYSGFGCEIGIGDSFQYKNYLATPVFKDLNILYSN